MPITATVNGIKVVPNDTDPEMRSVNKSGSVGPLFAAIRRNSTIITISVPATEVATLFPNEASLRRLVSAVLAEVYEEWQTGKRYLNTEID